MTNHPSDKPAPEAPHYNIVDLNYVSVYVKDLPQALAFYQRIFGPPGDAAENGAHYGWRMGATWLTLFPSRAGTSPDSNPRNAEYAVQVASAPEVDRLYQALLDAGAKSCMPPDDTRMYVPMRFACVDDPFGMRIDVYCPL